MFPNETLKHSLRQLQVYCTHRRDGCQWKGGLGDLAQHLSPDEECPLTVVEDTEDAQQGSHMTLKLCLVAVFDNFIGCIISFGNFGRHNLPILALNCQIIIWRTGKRMSPQSWC